MKIIATSGGFLFYLFQEGRGIGLQDKLRAMSLQDDHFVGTVEAFAQLGYRPDERNYALATEAMQAVGVPRRIRLMTNNPHKLAAVVAAGFEVVDRLEPVLRVSPELARIIRANQEALGHLPYENLLVDNLAHAISLPSIRDAGGITINGSDGQSLGCGSARRSRSVNGTKTIGRP
jgi:hypothetical protein